MAGAELRRLDDEPDVGPVRQGRAHVVGPVTHDDGRGAGRERGARADDVIDERPAGQRMDDLRHGGFHPCPFACGENDDVQPGHG